MKLFAGEVDLAPGADGINSVRLPFTAAPGELRRRAVS